MGTGFFVHHRIVSAVKRVEFVSDRVSYIVMRGRWCNIIQGGSNMIGTNAACLHRKESRSYLNHLVVLNVHAPSEDKSDDSKDSF